MQTKFKALMELIKEPLRSGGGIKTDNSILLIYPPEKELDFRAYLTDIFIPQLNAKKIPFQTIDLTGFLFENLDEEMIEELQEDEFEDYRWMKQGLSQRAERSLVNCVSKLSETVPGGVVIAYATVALFPLIRFGEVLRGMRDLNARIVIAFPGKERGGKLHFMNQPDGGNYLAIKIV
jgi:hypothetical protein